MKNAYWLILFFSFPAFSKVFINIGAPARVQKNLIAISPFVLKNLSSDQDKLGEEGERMSSQFRQNLEFSAYFNILSPKAFIENPALKEPVPYPKNSKGFRWQNWKLTGTDFLFFANYSINGDRLSLSAFFYNVHSQKKVFKKDYHGLLSQSHQIVDRLSNDIIYSLSGKKGIFETKILSVRSLSGSKKELFVMDWNGQNKKRLTYHRSIVLSPAWSPNGRKVAYSAFVYNKKLRKRVAGLFLYDFKRNKIQLLSAKEGSSLGSDFFPNGRQMLVTSSSGRGLLDIFVLNLKSLSFQPLTHGPPGVINVEPRIHPRTREIVFSSDRGGKTMIYLMNHQGKKLRQITFAGHYNSTPDWQAEKGSVIFSGLSKGRMDLFRISSKGKLKRLTRLKKRNGGWANSESPSISPDGRFVVFSSDVSGTYQLYVMSLNDLSIERITFDRYHYKSPKWSPYL